MIYHSKIKRKKFTWGGIVLASVFPAGKSASIVGSVSLPHRPGESELSDVHAQMLLEGTQQLDKRALQAELDAMGATLSFSAASNRLQFVARVRTMHLESLFALIAEILLSPTFQAPELEVLKKREEADLAMELQDTNTQASIALSRLLYAKEHPNYRQSTKESLAALKKITPAVLHNFHARLSGAGLVFSVAGDITAKNIFALAERYFKPLPHPKVTIPKTKLAAVPKPKKTVVTIKHKASIDYLAGISARVTNEHPDFAALALGIQVLGNRSGFTGRLMQIVREQEGLTYGVYTLLGGFTGKIDGHLYAWATFAPQLFERGRAAVLREIKRIVAEGASEEDVKKHRELFEARSRVVLSNSGAVARAAHDTVVDGKKLTYLDEFPQRILKLSTKEVNKALKKYLRPELLSETAAGPVEKL